MPPAHRQLALPMNYVQGPGELRARDRLKAGLEGVRGPRLRQPDLLEEIQPGLLGIFIVTAERPVKGRREKGGGTHRIGSERGDLLEPRQVLLPPNRRLRG